MDEPRGIIVFGANGSGKTTLGRELARILGYKHMDHEAYAFRESEIPYADPRTRAACVAGMLADIEKYGNFVLSAVTGDFGDRISRHYALGVSLWAPLELRLQRFAQREYARYGERVLLGGDLYASRMAFHDFIASRSLSKIEKWAETLVCPILRIDGTADWRQSAAAIAKKFCEIGATASAAGADGSQEASPW